jgi:hypothetical protein
MQKQITNISTVLNIIENEEKEYLMKKQII